MRERITKLLKGSVCALLAAIMLATSVSVSAFAAALVDKDAPVIVVSLGDSYSSGEGITEFYGQGKSEAQKVKDKNWLAHRSTKSWGGQLKVPGVPNTMSDYNVENGKNPECEWYFRAVTGARSYHFAAGIATSGSENDQNGIQTIKLRRSVFDKLKEIPFAPQTNVFDEIDGEVDFVTFSIGGNDVNFGDIVTSCVTGSTYIGTSSLSEDLARIWDGFDETRTRIKKAYQAVEDKAGKQAAIIVAGYPKLFDQDGRGPAISYEEAFLVNYNVSLFNDELEKLVKECQREGMNIEFVDVEDAFDGHEAYSKEAWINKIWLKPRSEDTNQVKIGSAYSVHPNARGAQEYAKLVNAKIEEIINKQGTLSGKVCKASDRMTPVSDASITVYKGRSNEPITTVGVDASGNYNIKLPEYDSYRIEISAPGYIPFSSFAKVVAKTCTYTETFLMVEGAEGMTGTATGTISDALTGRGVGGVGLIIRKGWNNHSYGDVVDSAITDANGAYSVTLPLGNYTLCTYKEGYIAGMVNIVVQEGTTGSQNGTITPVISGDSYRIVLTWGENPRDLDSHVEGPLSNGSGFHVYYSHKSQYDGDIEVCNLDVDDTTSYGPETITLNPVASGTYYYYIYRYAGSGTVASSGAKITVYQGENEVAVFNVPTDQGGGDYWNVFAIKDGQLIIQNTITSSKDVSYASPIATLAANFAVEEDMPKKDDIIVEEEKPAVIPEDAMAELPDELTDEKEPSTDI